jgi:uncharacterized membrane protein
MIAKARYASLAALSVLVGLGGRGAEASSFTGIGFLSGHTNSSVNGVSADGSTVVGSSGGYIARWTEAGGIDDVGGRRLAGAAYAVSADGATIVGTAGEEFSVYWGFGAFRHVEGSGFQGLNTVDMGFGSAALAVTADGQLVGGERYNAYEGVIWDAAGAAQATSMSTIRGFSADGGYRLGVVIAGFVGGGGYWKTYRITADGTAEDIGHLTDADYTQGYAISSDGSAIVGIDNRGGPHDSDPTAFLWTGTGGLISLGRLAGDSSSTGLGLTTTGDLGTTVVGQSGDRAFLWTESLGMVDLKSYLTSHGADLTGWTLTNATGISADGLTIVGNGLNADGEVEGWVARLSPAAVPEPSSVVMAGLGLLGGLGLAARRRFGRRA